MSYVVEVADNQMHKEVRDMIWEAGVGGCADNGAGKGCCGGDGRTSLE